MKDNITELLGIKYPIIQGGMAWIADADLAIAVSNAGGLGTIASGSADANFIREQIKKAKKLTDKPFGVNVMLMNPDVDNIIKMLIDEKPAVVTTGAGNPAKYLQNLKDAGIKVIPVVANVALSLRCERAGADAIIAEGTEAGGHIGELTTMVLVPQVVDAVSIPVIAAGGIADKRGVAAAFALGAKGVQVGTRFLVANEANISENYKDAIIKAKDSSTCATGRSTGYPVRCLKNRLAKDIIRQEKEGLSAEDFEEKMSGTLRAAVVNGDTVNGSLMSGQIAGLINKKETVKEIIQDMFDEQ
ncbi:MAG: enoyl-[acyl-carrier-protein] reductase FabK [Clostridiales Family XIII bacterium]|nr:enoyl-[acyl-carrier-protein] reductase FabK [Clostridiales Family XIII bacterium]